jgi:dCMP deaminase
MTKRPAWDLYFLSIADAVATRADCTRRHVGAVVVDPATKHIIATGYNGSPPGEAGCLSDGACPRGRHYKIFRNYGMYAETGYACACGNPAWPCPLSVPAGSSYDTGMGACIALHAEQNAILRAGTQSRGAWMFLTDEPCEGCWRLIKGAGFSRVEWYTGQWTPTKPKRNLKVWLWRLVPDPIAKRLTFRSGKPTPSC